MVDLAQRFKLVQPEDMAKLEDEFMDYQLSPSAELPPFVPGVDWLDGFWAAMAQLKTGVGCLRFDYLCGVMLPLLCLPNSNADSERVLDGQENSDGLQV